jgi:hypothetical protein
VEAGENRWKQGETCGYRGKQVDKMENMRR